MGPYILTHSPCGFMSINITNLGHKSLYIVPTSGYLEPKGQPLNPCHYFVNNTSGPKPSKQSPKQRAASSPRVRGPGIPASVQGFVQASGKFPLPALQRENVGTIFGHSLC